MRNQITSIKNSGIRTLSPEEYTAGIASVRTCLGIRPNESIVVVADKTTWDKEATVIFETAKSISKNTTLMMYPGPKQNGEEPPPEITQMMLRADVVLLITRMSLSHTKARLDACLQGCRIASMPGITLGMMKRTLNPDYRALSFITTKLTTLFTCGKKVRIISPAGTDMTLTISGRTGIADTGDLKKPGSFGNLPAGEAFIAPCEQTAEGILIIDGSFANIQLDMPMAITIKNGKIQSITGKKAAATLMSQLASLPPKASWVCEFGIGTNPKAKISSRILEAEKTFGTCHIAFGRNCTFGGNIDVPYHADGLVKEPTVILDGKKILAGGKFLV